MSFDLDRAFEERIQISSLPTPIVPLDSVLKQKKIWVDLKRDDLIGDLATGTKMRALSFIFHKAVQDGVTDVITLGETTSNQCRLVAVWGARHQMRTHLLLREQRELGEADDNVAILRMFGASLQYLSDDEWRLHGLAAKRLTSRIRKQGGKALFIPFGCGGFPGVFGIIDLMTEVVAAHDGHCPYSHVIVPTGSGSTLFGLDLATQILDLSPAPKLLGVSVSQDSPTLLSQIDRLYAQTTPALGWSIERSNRLLVDDSFRDLSPAQLIAELQRIVDVYGVLPDPLYVLRAFLALERCLEGGEIDSQSRVLILVSGACRTLHATQQRAVNLHREPEHEYR